MRLRTIGGGGRFLFGGILTAAMLLAPAAGPARSAETKAAADPDNTQWSVTLVGFFPSEGRKKTTEPKRLNCYLVRRDGKWSAALATPTNAGRPIWNTAFMLVDPSGATVKDGRLAGTLAVTLVPDPWVPADQKPRAATVTLDAVVTPDPTAADGKAFARLSGTWKADVAGPADEL